MYFDDYDEYFDDCLEDEMSALINSHIKPKIESVINKYNDALKCLNEIEAKTRKKEMEFDRLTQSIKELKQEEENVKAENLHKMPKKYIDEFVRRYTGGYVSGDEVWVLTSVSEYKKCDLCGGAKEVEVVSAGQKKTICCPRCNCRGEISRTKNVVKKATVSRVVFNLNCGNEISTWNGECVYLDDDLYATSPDKIFRTKEEAEQALKDAGGKDV